MADQIEATRVGNWDINQWAQFFTAGRAPRSKLSRLTGQAISWDFFDLSSFNWLQNSISERCELAAGIVLTAEHLGYLNSEKALVVIGRGPSAFFAAITALSRGFRVLFVAKENNSRFLSPLIGASHRFVSPHFYKKAWKTTELPEWKIKLTAFRDSTAMNFLRWFSYSEEAAAGIADRWTRLWKSAQLAMDWEEIVLENLNFSNNPSVDTSMLDAAMTSALSSLGFRLTPGLVLNCRFSDREPLQIFDAQKPPKVAYTSLPYWAAKPERWMKRDLPIAISGAGDGALQDFLRACWGWNRPSEGLAIYTNLFPESNRQAVASIAEQADSLRAQMERVWYEWVTVHLKHRTHPSKVFALLLRNERSEKAKVVSVVHGTMMELAGKLLALATINPTSLIGNGSVYLQTTWSEFGPCYAHNHLLGLFTIKLLRRRGYQPWIIDPDGPDITFMEVRNRDPSDADDCVVNALPFLVFDYNPPATLFPLRLHIPIGGGSRVTKDICFLLLRYGPSRDKAFRQKVGT